MKQNLKTIGLGLLLLASPFLSHADGGMYPISELIRLNLQAMGLTVTADQIFNPNGPSLSQALVQVGGCTGSFLSKQGLIVTNHHCTFGNVAGISTPQRDLTGPGYYAKTQAEELALPGLECRIMVGYSDISPRILNGTQTLLAAPRFEKIRTAMRALEDSAERADSNYTYEVSEMVVGVRYVLFKYQTLRDIRLVYIPPRAIGEFGGESDNWEWPRHSGDFSFVRAYVGPKGEVRGYDPSNVPFVPKVTLAIDTAGPKENDRVFILGYPGRTFRNYPSGYVRYQQEHQMPFIAELFEWQIAKMQELSSSDPTYALKVSGRIKGLANTSKNYRGKLQGMKRIPIVAQKEAEEGKMRGYGRLNSVPGVDIKLLDDQIAIYRELNAEARNLLWHEQLLQSSLYAQMGLQFISIQDSLAKLGKQAKNGVAPMHAKFVELFQKRLVTAKSEYERELLKLFWTNKNLYGGAYGPSIQDESLWAMVTLPTKTDAKTLLAFYKSSPAFTEWLRFFKANAVKNQALRARLNAETSSGLANYALLKQAFQGEAFLPDANSTLRFTVGSVKAFSPNDAVTNFTNTTVAGILEKDAMGGEYELPDSIQVALSDATIAKQPVNFLYNLDTTGGNSGSPVLNKNGAFIGINFDRAYTATINDFAWNDNYSRSVGCDVRYMRFVIQKIAKADRLAKELNL